MIIYNSSSTGTSEALSFNAPVTTLGLQPSGTATFSVEGSIGGAWVAVVASSTYGANVIVDSTGLMVTQVRAVLTAVGSTDFQLHVVGV